MIASADRVLVADWAYFLSIVLFALALGGMSSAAWRRAAIWCGMAGAVLALCTTLAVHNAAPLPELLITLGAGAVAGIVASRRTPLPAMARLVGLLHIFTAVAAFLAGWAALADPEALGMIAPGGPAFPTRDGMAFYLCIGAGGVAAAGAMLWLFMRQGGGARIIRLHVPASCTGMAAIALGLAGAMPVLIAMGGMVMLSGISLFREMGSQRRRWP